MAPTESTILENYLLIPAQLPAIISLKEFTEFFPRSQQSSPHIRTLYRDLQTQRNSVVDSVSSSIEDESSNGKRLRREVVKARREAESHEVDDEIEIERALYGTAAGIQDPKHSLISIVKELESAASDLEARLQNLEAEEAELLNTVKQTVGSMSDLRYGRLANGQLREQVLEGLENVQATCERTL